MKSIAIFSGYYFPHVGGIETYIDRLAHRLVQMGYHPILINCNYMNLPDVEEKEGMTILRLPVYSIFKNRYPIPKKNKRFKQLMKKLDTYEIVSVIVNTRFHLTSHIGAKYAKKRGVSAYLIEHGSKYVTLDHKFIDFFANRYEDFLTWRMKPKIKGFYGVSQACSDWLQHFHIQAAGTWYNSINIDQEVPTKKEHDGVRYFFAGRLIRQKGVDNILQAFMKLRKEKEDIYLTIAGDGPLLEKYKQEYPDDHIQFVGRISNEKVLETLAESDVFLYPPLWPEGLPSSILEAGMMECMTIGTDQGGIKEIIEDGKNGLIVEGTSEALYQAMKEMYDDPAYRESLARNLRKTIETKFSWQNTAKKILKDMGVK